MKVSEDIQYIGVNDHAVDLFEGQYVVPNGMSYNSYVILDEKIAVMDTVDIRFTGEWLDRLSEKLQGRRPDYLIIQHVEPDHSANIEAFLNVYPDVTIVSNAKAFVMMDQFYRLPEEIKRLTVTDGESLVLGKHTLTFVFAPMVHWPEVMVTYDCTDKVLFSADGFGKFGANDVEEPWEDEARRYYIGIVGKYGAQVQRLLGKAAQLDIAVIAPLHGPVLTENLGRYLKLYDTWSSYLPETEGVVIAYTSVYGHTKEAALYLADKVKENGAVNVEIYDLARCDMAQAVAAAFRYNRLVLATTTYNADIYPFMRTFIEHLTERNFKDRTVALIENGTWAPLAARGMKELLASAKNLTMLEPVTIRSAMTENNKKELDTLALSLCGEAADAPEKTVQDAAPAQSGKSWVCKVCGYVYEGETLPQDFVCPLCKRGAEYFEPAQV